jgi:hypothetical protein
MRSYLRVRLIHTIHHRNCYNDVQRTSTEYFLLGLDMPNIYNKLCAISCRTAILSTLIHVKDTHKPLHVNCLSNTKEVQLAHFIV